MKFILLILLVFVFLQTGYSQTVRTTTVDELLNRVDAPNDTIYVVNFWATWCLPCLEELPHFDKLASNFKTDHLKILLVSLDFQSKMETTLIPYLKKENIQNEVLLLVEKDLETAISRLDTKWSGTIPATLFIYKKKRSFFERDFTYNELLSEYKKMIEP